MGLEEMGRESQTTKMEVLEPSWGWSRAGGCNRFLLVP